MSRGEEGFTLVEAIVAAGLLAFSVMGFTATVLVALHVVNEAKANDAMDVVAHNALVDLYAVSAYDNGAAASLLGQTRTYAVAPYTVSVRVYSAAAGEVDATVQVSDTLGKTTAMHGILAQAAPAPGSAFTPTYASQTGQSSL